MQNSIGTANVQNPDVVPSLPQAVDSAHSAMSQAEQTVESLEKRLETVLSEEGQHARDFQGEPAAPPSTKIIAGIGSLERRIWSLEQRIVSIMKRLHS